MVAVAADDVACCWPGLARPGLADWACRGRSLAGWLADCGRVRWDGCWLMAAWCLVLCAGAVCDCVPKSERWKEIFICAPRRLIVKL